MNKPKKTKIKYSFKEDVFLGIPLKRDYDSSFQIGNFIFDLDKKGKINGIEILNASKIFNIPKRFLNHIEEAKIEIEANDQFIKLKIHIKTLVRNLHKTSSLNIERIRPDFINPSELNLAIV